MNFLQLILPVLIISWYSVLPAVTDDFETPRLIPFLVNEFDLHNQNWSIDQDTASHFIYLANSGGLIEYNGIRFREYILEDNLPVRSVAVHSSGKIFTGSFEEFGFWHSDGSGQLAYNSLTHLTEVERNDEIWKIYILDGKVYFQSFTSVYVYDSGKVEKIMAPYTMLFMHLPGDRFIAQIIDHGLYLFDGEEFEFIQNSEIFAGKKVHAIIRGEDEGWLVCTSNDGIYIYDGSDFSYLRSEASAFLERYTFNTASRLNDSTFAFGSILNGVIITDRDGNILRVQNADNGLKNNTVLSLFVDADKGLWVGLDQGVNYIDLFSPFTHYQSRNGTMGTIYAMLKHENFLYIGTNHGLFRAEIERKGQLWDFDNITFITGSHGQVWTLEMFDGQILCGHNDGTFLVDDGYLHSVSAVTGGWSIKPFGEHIIAGTYTGIIFLERDHNGIWRQMHKVDNFNEPTRYIETDYLGYVWASHHQKGIYKIELSGDLTEAASVEYFPSIYGKSFNIKTFKVNNRVLFVTPEEIYTFDFVRNQIVPFDALTEHLEDFRSVDQISRHKPNQYWFIRNDKLALFEIGLDFSARKLYEVQHENINLPQREIRLLPLDDNSIIISNPHSFDVFDIQKYEMKTDVSRLGIDKLLFYGRRDTVIFSEFSGDLAVPWNVNNVAVHFSDPSLFGRASRAFRYRIAELDPTWQNTVSDRFILPGLKPGKYTLELKGRGENIVAVPFTVGKPWYHSYPALIVYAFILALLAWSLKKFFSYELSRHKELTAMEMRQSSLEKELNYKSYELMLTMRHLLLKDGILKDLQEQILAIKEESSKYPVKSINRMEQVINKGLGVQSAEWENVMNTLKLTQQGFFKSLKKRYPQLTPNDLRLCSYLRMNFNTKEIAQLLNISTRSVEISRHRLRKKLKLSQDENLFEFLMKAEPEK